MAQISAYSSIASGTADSNRCYASVVSHNFTRIQTAINSNALNSNNYSQSGLLGSQIANSQIQSYHISAGAVQSSNVSASGILDQHMNYSSTCANAVRLVRVGDAFSNVPASGVQIARYSKVVTYQTDGNVMSATDAPVRHQITVQFSDAIGGPLTFASAPWFVACPVASWGADAQADTRIWGANDKGFRDVFMKKVGVNSCEMEFRYYYSHTATYAFTCYFAVVGAKSGT